MSDQKEDQKEQILSVEHGYESAPEPAGAPNQADYESEAFAWGMPGPYTGLICYAGRMRSDFTTLNVRTDAEAVAAWVAEKGSESAHTARSYRREAERLMLWAHYYRGKSLSDLAREDFLQYARFLEDPRPEADWVMTRRYPRSSKNWRPFCGPLSEDSRSQSLRILFGMMSYLVSTGWLRANPMPSPKGKRSAPFRPTTRSLSPAQWQSVWHNVCNQPKETPKQALMAARERWALALFHSMGPRIAEACSSWMGDMMPAPDDQGWEWHMLRKGRKRTVLPLAPEVLEELWRFRRALNLSPYPAPSEAAPLIPSFSRMTKDGGIDPYRLAPLSSNQCYRMVVEVFRRTADSVETEEPQNAERLRHASTHWLRHTALREMFDATSDMRMVQMLGGHADINTSAAYARTDDAALRSAFRARNNSGGEK